MSGPGPVHCCSSAKLVVAALCPPRAADNSRARPVRSAVRSETAVTMRNPSAKNVRAIAPVIAWIRSRHLCLSYPDILRISRENQLDLCLPV